MPPEIIDIVIKAVGEWIVGMKAAGGGFSGFSEFIDIVIKATPMVPAWLADHIDIVLKATPGFHNPGVLFYMAGFGFFLLMCWWFWEPERG